MVNFKSLKKALRSYKKSLKKRNNAERAAYMKTMKFNNAGKTKRKRKRRKRRRGGGQGSGCMCTGKKKRGRRTKKRKKRSRNGGTCKSH